MIAISVQRYDLFIQASRLLQRYRQLNPELRSVGVEVALAIQYHRAQLESRRAYERQIDPLPWIGSARGMTMQQVAQQICDPFYTKKHLHLPSLEPSGEALIWPLFNQGEEGLIQPLAPSHLGGSLTERRWLKGCNSQEGIGCHALAHHLWQDENFLAEDRDLCPFRLYDGHYPLDVDQGRQTCGFDDHPCGWQPGHPKMLQIIGKGRQAEILQAPWTEAMWRMLIPVHRPIPVYPVLVILYFGHEDLQQGRTMVTPEQFRLDLSFSLTQFRQIFDLNPDSFLNHHLLSLAEQPPLEWDTSGTTSVSFSTPLRALHSIHQPNQPAGGRVVLDPDEPPQFRSSGLAGRTGADPLLAERRRRRQLERSARHNELLHRFRRWFRLAGLEVREDQLYFDFLAVGHGYLLLAEIKLLYQQDMSESIQEVVGQLLFYERFTLLSWIEQGYRIQKAAVFDRPPLGEYIRFLADLGIATYWLTEDHRIDGSEDSLRWLRQMEVQTRPDPEFPDGS
jgi:hypothetical protein